jgi:predicted nucleic acid-binding protein
MIVVDASVAIAGLDGADAHHEPAVQMLLDHTDVDLVLHPLSLAEVLVGPTRVGNTRLAHVRLLEAGFRADVTDSDQPLRLARLRVETGLKLPDCCVLDVATFHGARLATFDRRLADVAREHGLEVVPAS